MKNDKKSLLFVMDTFPLGGIAKSLLALFAELGTNYDIEFILMKHEGLFLPLIPANVHLLSEPIGREFRNPHPKYTLHYLFNLSPARFFRWFMFSLKCSLSKSLGGQYKMLQTMDVEYAQNATSQNKEYDAAIAYQGGRCIYYIIDKVKAKKKIGYVHSDYAISEMDYCLKEADLQYFPQLDYIITISDKCAHSLKNEFPDCSAKIKVVENICSVNHIRQLATAETKNLKIGTEIIIVSMGRLDIDTKGIDFAISACQLLKHRKYNFIWYWLGDGTSRNEIEAMIQAAGVDNNFVLLGAKTNPYPYIKQADIYVQPSRFEGKSVALDEVKALGKPCVVTNFSTVRDQFVDNITALIAEMNADAIAEKIEVLINNKELREALSNNLSSEDVDNCNQVIIFESLIN